MKRKTKFSILLLTAILLVVITFCAVYVNDYYRTDYEAIAAFSTDVETYVTTFDDNTVIYTPENPKAGLIFYPGGKVEYTAYEPLMQMCASEGILCVLVEMPLNLAVLDANAAQGIQEKFPDINNWYIGGHSLGGSMAASYLSENTESFDGLILLGSYSTADLSSTSVKVLSVFGTEDMILNRDKYEQSRANLPADYTELAINGGCHAYFGMYGEQDGDGTATISNTEQIEITVDAITDLILN